jgi:hypothetical protein
MKARDEMRPRCHADPLGFPRGCSISWHHVGFAFRPLGFTEPALPIDAVVSALLAKK